MPCSGLPKSGGSPEAPFAEQLDPAKLLAHERQFRIGFRIFALGEDGLLRVEAVSFDLSLNSFCGSSVLDHRPRIDRRMTGLVSVVKEHIFFAFGRKRVLQRLVHNRQAAFGRRELQPVPQPREKVRLRRFLSR